MNVQHTDMRNTVDTLQAFAYSLRGDIKEKGNTGAGLTLALQNLMNRQQPKYFNGRPSVDALLIFSDMDDKVTNDNLSARPHAFEPRHVT